MDKIAIVSEDHRPHASINKRESFLLVSGKLCPAAMTIIVVMGCPIIMLMVPMGAESGLNTPSKL